MGHILGGLMSMGVCPRGSVSIEGQTEGAWGTPIGVPSMTLRLSPWTVCVLSLRAEQEERPHVPLLS